MAWHPFRNLGLKFAAVALGTLLWLTVSGQQAERSVRLGVEFRKVPAGMEITGDPPETVDVWIRGASSQISRLGLGDVVAYVDLSDATAGHQQSFPMLTEQPIGVEVTRVDPKEITLSLEKSGRATVSVRVVTGGQPAAGYAVAQAGVSVDPPTIEIAGPESHLKTLPAVTTEPVSIEGATSDVTATVNVIVEDDVLRVRQSRAVRVTVKIVRIRQEH